jgi:hypothetical protein
LLYLPFVTREAQHSRRRGQARADAREERHERACTITSAHLSPRNDLDCDNVAASGRSPVLAGGL